MAWPLTSSTTLLRSVSVRSTVSRNSIYPKALEIVKFGTFLKNIAGISFNSAKVGLMIYPSPGGRVVNLTTASAVNSGVASPL